MSSPIIGTLSTAPAGSVTARIDGEDRLIARWHDGTTASACHGFWHDALLVVPSVLFVLYLGFRTRRNVKKLSHGSRSYIMIAYYALLWFVALLNLAWSSLQAWQCTPGKQVAWSLLSLFAASGMLCLEISLMGFLFQESYATGLETLARTFAVSGIVVGIDMLLKAVLIFVVGVPLFIEVEMPRGKWGIWFIHKLLLTAAYAYILFVHYSKWRDKLPPKPAFYNYVIIMFMVNAIVVFASGLAGLGAGFGLWYPEFIEPILLIDTKFDLFCFTKHLGINRLIFYRLYNFSVICYHSLYLPFIYVTFLADFFQEEDWLLDSAYYSEMRDAGFFDAECN